jgi:hypothetical protein
MFKEAMTHLPDAYKAAARLLARFAALSPAQTAEMRQWLENQVEQIRRDGRIRLTE